MARSPPANGTDPVKAAFEGEGFLGHLFDTRDIDKWISGSEPWFPVHRDCGPSCTATTLHRKDLPFSLALMADFTNQAVGYISSLDKLQHRVAAMSPTDSNSVNRNCCQSGESKVAAAYNPAYCNASCDGSHGDGSHGDQYRMDECMANHAGGGMNVQAMQDVGCNQGTVQGGTCDACLPGGAAAPFWCDKAGVNTAEDWIAEYMPEGQIGQLWRNQCKFRRQTWDTFVNTTKLLHATLEARGEGYQQAWIETEVNLYFDETKDKRDQPEWEEAIIGVFYMDMDSSGQWLSPASESNWGSYDSSNAQRLGAAMVKHYNKLHPKTPIRLYRAAAEPPQKVAFWRAGKELRFENYLQAVPLSGMKATATPDIIDGTAGGSERTDEQPWETGQPGQEAPDVQAAAPGDWASEQEARQRAEEARLAAEAEAAEAARLAAEAEAEAEAQAETTAAEEAPQREQQSPATDAADAAEPLRSADAAKPAEPAKPAERCTAHHGGNKPCCGQSKRDPSDPQDVRPCPQSTPTCEKYVYGHSIGTCRRDEWPAPDGPAALVGHELNKARPAVLVSHASSWTLDPRALYEEPGQFTGCPDGQRNAAESECFAAVQEATHALGELL